MKIKKYLYVRLSDATSIIQKSVHSLEPETVAIEYAAGRILAADVKSRCDVPGFDNSAMDGYAVRAADIRGASEKNPVILKVTGESPIGTVYKGALREMAAIRIATGSVIPKGADTIVREEFAEESGGFVRISREFPERTDCRFRGEDLRAGRVVLKKGAKLSGHDVALLASIGETKIKTGKQPRVGILATGNELVPPGKNPKPGQVRASSGPAIAAECADAGADVVSSVIVKDELSAMTVAFRKLAKTADAIMTTGGVSVGKADYAKEALVRAGGKIIYEKVRVRPGSPFSFGVIKGIPVFMLPGNPAAALLVFEYFTRPALLLMQGANPNRLEIPAVLAEEVKRRPPFAHFIRCGLDFSGGKAKCVPLSGQGSGIVSSLAAADGIFVMPEKITRIPKGKIVRVRMLSR